MISLHHRLVLWHTAVFAAGLLGFALVIWLGAREILNGEIERWLGTQAEGLARFLRLETKGSGEAAVIEEAREFSTGLPHGSGIRLYRSDGFLLYSHPREESPDAGRARVLERRTSIQRQEYRIVLWRSYDEAEETLRRLAVLLAGLIPAFLVLSAAGGWWLSRRALKPVDELTSAARAVSLSRMSDRLALPPWRDELYRLCVAWNEMLARLEDSAKRLKEFTANASHELRTPVAVIRATADLTLRQERAPGDYRNALRKIKEQSAEMSELLDNLLALARADRDGIQNGFAVLDLAALAREIEGRLRETAAARDIEFTVSAPSGSAPVLGDRASLQRLFLLLTDNATKFTPAQGRVEIRIHKDGPGVTLEVSDTGIGIDKPHIPRIFDRFYQADPSHSSPGAGLGLALAQWIVTQHHATVEVDSSPGQGSVFRVAFPPLPVELSKPVQSR